MFQKSDEGVHDTMTTYNLHDSDGYFLLDDYVKQVESISDYHFRHYGAGIANVEVGSIILGSTNADYAQSNTALKSWLDVTGRISQNTRMNP